MKYRNDGEAWGPIVSPLENGANLTWWTKTPQQTQACIGNVLYFGSNFLNETQQWPNCSFKVTVPETNYHQIFVNLSKFNATINGKQVDFDNSDLLKKNQTVRILVTTDVHDNAEMIQKAHQDIDDFDFHMHAGDMVLWGVDYEQYLTYEYHHQKPFVQAHGNHDQLARAQV